MDDGHELALLVEAYMRLLRLPLRSQSRHRLTHAMVGLRDEIARISPGWTAEGVQGACEGVAALLGHDHG